MDRNDTSKTAKIIVFPPTRLYLYYYSAHFLIGPYQRLYIVAAGNRNTKFYTLSNKASWKMYRWYGPIKNVKNSIGIIVWVRRQLFLLFSMCHFGPYSLIYKLVQFFYINCVIRFKKGQNPYISPIGRDYPCKPISIKFGISM